MTTVIIVARGRPDLLEQSLYSLWESNLRPHTIVVANCDQTAEYISRLAWIEPIVPERNIGFWGGVNLALTTLPSDEPFCYFGQDVVFDKDWLTHAEKVFRIIYPSGLGVLTFRDDIVNGRNASHGMTTKRWLYVLYGQSEFPSPPYTHFFCDSELSQRSKDFGRYFYCLESHVAHKHEMSGFDYPEHHIHLMHNDKLIEDERYKQWINGEDVRATRRLMELQ